ncbi:MAG: HEAT repeat domain-containing protein [Planctomycetota bacterium]|nr:HEAT repeat domain-containing protein [Planctomycetota bacterium]
MLAGLPMMEFRFEQKSHLGDWGHTQFGWTGAHEKKGASGRSETRDTTYEEARRTDVPRMPARLRAWFEDTQDVLGRFRVGALGGGALALLALLLPGGRRLRAGMLLVAALLLLASTLYLRFGFDAASRDLWSTLRSGAFAGQDWSRGLLRSTLDTERATALLGLPLAPQVLLGTSALALIGSIAGLVRADRTPRGGPRTRTWLILVLVVAAAGGAYLLFTGGYETELEELRAAVERRDRRAAVSVAERHAREHGSAFLYAALEEDDVYVRAIAAEVLGTHFDRREGPHDEDEVAEAVRRLVDQLGDGEELMHDASEAIREIRKDWIGPIARALANHPDPRVRAGAAQALTYWRSEPEVQEGFLAPRLADALDDEQPRVQQAAAMSLLNLHDRPTKLYPRIVPLLLDAAADEARRHDARFALEKLEREDWDHAAPHLQGRLDDERLWVRGTAALVMLRMDADTAAEVPGLGDTVVELLAKTDVLKERGVQDLLHALRDGSESGRALVRRIEAEALQLR